jgi:hypothetical protein
MRSGYVTLGRLLAAVATFFAGDLCRQYDFGCIPPKLLDPVCQLQLTGGLIRFGPLALIGFLLMPLAS